MPMPIVKISNMLSIGKVGRVCSINTLPARSGATLPQRFDHTLTVMCDIKRSCSTRASSIDVMPILIYENGGVHEICFHIISETRNESMVGIVTMWIVFVKATLIVLSAIFSPHFLFPAPVGAIDQALCAAQNRHL